jgi:hypothetical protein
MTDPALDELASAHLDGATSREEAARIAADPALQARVEELRRVRAAMGSPVAIDPARREAAIAAALAAFADTEDDEDSASAPVGPLATLAARRGPSPRAVRVLGAAAAVVLLALLVPLLGRLALSADDDSEASFESTGAAIEGASPDAQDSGAAAPTSTTAALGDEDLGAFDDLQALAETLSGTDALAFEDGAESEAATPAEGRCTAETTEERAGGTTVVDRALATVSGEPVIVVIVRGTVSGPGTLRVYRVADCTLVAELPL